MSCVITQRGWSASGNYWRPVALVLMVRWNSNRRTNHQRSIVLNGTVWVSTTSYENRVHVTQPYQTRSPRTSLSVGKAKPRKWVGVGLPNLRLVCSRATTAAKGVKMLNGVHLPKRWTELGLEN